MNLYRRENAHGVTYLEPSMKYKLHKPRKAQYWELHEFRTNKYVVARYFIHFKNAKQYLKNILEEPTI